MLNLTKKIFFIPYVMYSFIKNIPAIFRRPKKEHHAFIFAENMVFYFFKLIHFKSDHQTALLCIKAAQCSGLCNDKFCFREFCQHRLFQ